MLIGTGLTAGDRLVIRAGEACDVLDTPGGVEVVLDDNTRIAADAAVLAVGNLPPHDPPGVGGDALPPDLYVRDPWGDDPCADLADGDRVVLLGTGLTAVDVALALEHPALAGEILPLSLPELGPPRPVDVPHPHLFTTRTHPQLTTCHVCVESA